MNATIKGYVLTAGDRINRRIENFRKAFIAEMEKEEKTQVPLEDLSTILLAIQKMVSCETSEIGRRR